MAIQNHTLSRKVGFVMPGFKTVNGYQWPERDEDCAAVVFNYVQDMELALSHCQDFRAAIQAGGNCGVWANYLADKFGAVFTFEPEPDNYTCLIHNAKRNVAAFPYALGDRNARTTVEFPEGVRNYGAVQVSGPGSGNIIMTLGDEVVPAYHPIGFIQLDIEGYEPYALNGLKRIIKQYKPVIMLEDKGLTKRWGLEEGWSIDYMKALDYKFHTRVNRDNIFLPEGYNAG